jgi:hypothetical protein
MEPQVDSNAKLFIRMAVADGVIAPDEKMYVKLIGGYVIKSAKDSQPGDLAVSRRDCINKRVEDIAGGIREGSMMYRLAEDRLYRSPNIQDGSERCASQDIRKPLLSVLLLEGLTRGSAESKQTLEDKIYGTNNQGFTPEEYTRFAEQVHAVLEKGLINRNKHLDHLVSIDTIKEWLKGETLAPMNWDSLECLIEINPEFEAELHEEKAGLNLRSAYDFFTQTRRVVMNSLLHAPNTSGQLNGEGQKGKGKYALEIQLAMAQLIDSVDSTTIASRVMSIESLGTQKIGPKAERAIYTGPLNVPILPMQHVKEISYLLDNALYNILEKYTHQRSLITATEALKELGIDMGSFDSTQALFDSIPLFKRKGIELIPEEKDKSLPIEKLRELFIMKAMTYGYKTNRKMSRADTYFVAIADIFQKLIRICPKERYVADTNKGMMKTTGKSAAEIDCTLESMYQEFNSTLTGQQDEFRKLTGIETRDFYTLVDLVNRYRSALPKRYLETESNEAQTAINYHAFTKLKGAPRRERRDMRQTVKRGFSKHIRLHAQLEREYGIRDKQRLLFLTALVDPSKGVFTNEDKIDIQSSSPASLQKQKEALERQESLVFYKRREVVEILESLGIPGIIKAYNPKNFLELFVQPTPKPSVDRYDGPWRPTL